MSLTMLSPFSSHTVDMMTIDEDVIGSVLATVSSLDDNSIRLDDLSASSSAILASFLATGEIHETRDMHAMCACYKAADRLGIHGLLRQIEAVLGDRLEMRDLISDEVMKLYAGFPRVEGMCDYIKGRRGPDISQEDVILGLEKHAAIFILHRGEYKLIIDARDKEAPELVGWMLETENPDMSPYSTAAHVTFSGKINATALEKVRVNGNMTLESIEMIMENVIETVESTSISPYVTYVPELTAIDMIIGMYPRDEASAELTSMVFARNYLWSSYY